MDRRLSRIGFVLPSLLAMLLAMLLLAACGGVAQGDAAGASPTGTPRAAAASASPSPGSTPTQASATAAASPTSQPTAAQQAAGSAAATGLGSFSGAIRQVAQQVKPGVVQITNVQTQLDQFNQPYTVPAGVGSGVIYDDQGHILTNAHVVEGAQKLQVSLPDGRSFQGKLIGADPQTDLAVVQISGSNLPRAKLGSSASLQVGDWVVAIGNSLALPGGPTVTAGVVSALDRTVQEPGSTSGTAGPFLFDVIQTSAPINPGNSGGPLVDLNGNVVGIDTLVASQTSSGETVQGIGFAIAIDTAKPIADQLVASGQVVHPYLGISYVPLNPAIAAQLGISQTEGVVVNQVVAGSPAARAGLQHLDVITQIEGTALKTDSDLAKLLNSHKPGDTVTLTVLRNGQTQNLSVTLGQRPTS